MNLLLKGRHHTTLQATEFNILFEPIYLIMQARTVLIIIA